MFDRFTDRARKVMGLARTEAQRIHHQYIGTEHILLGLIQEGSGVASHVLQNFDVDPEKIRVEVEKLIQRGPTMETMGQLPFTPRCKRLLELSGASAQEMKHNYIGTEHLLLGLIRENEGIAAQVLTNLGVKLEDVHDEVLETLGPDLQRSKDYAPGSPDDPNFCGSAFFDRYQEFTGSTAIYPGAGTGSYEAVVYCALKGAGECGEFAEKLGKRMRKAGSISAISRAEMSDDFRLELVKELGDRLWYISQAASELGYKMSEVAQINIDKLSSRKQRGVIDGEGDNR